MRSRPCASPINTTGPRGPSPTEPPEVLTVEDVAAILRITRNGAYTFARQWLATDGVGRLCVTLERTFEFSPQHRSASVMNPRPRWPRAAPVKDMRGHHRSSIRRPLVSPEDATAGRQWRDRCNILQGLSPTDTRGTLRSRRRCRCRRCRCSCATKCGIATPVRAASSTRKRHRATRSSRARPLDRRKGTQVAS